MIADDRFRAKVGAGEEEGGSVSMRELSMQRSCCRT